MASGVAPPAPYDSYALHAGYAPLADEAAANARKPCPITVTFRPRKNTTYCSRFRMDVEHGEGFDVVLQGAGSYEEDVMPRAVRVAGAA